MPNWCSTLVAAVADSKDPDAIQQLSDLSDLFCSEPEVREHASADWLGNFLAASGLDPEAIPCRSFLVAVGTIQRFEENTFFVIESEDAWFPAYGAWDALMQHPLYNKLRYVVFAEEPACGVYVNTDTSKQIFPSEYVLDYSADVDGRYCIENKLYYNNLKDFLEKIKDVFGVEASTFEEACRMLNDFAEKHDGSFISVGHFENV